MDDPTFPAFTGRISIVWAIMTHTIDTVILCFTGFTGGENLFH
jgi:hypothetical protein